MTQLDRFDRELPLALRDVAGPHSPDYLTDILGRTAHTRQRPAWASLERWLPMDLASPRAATARIPWRAIGALALIALLIVAAAAFYAGSRHRVPAPFGPANNGVIPYGANGDIFLGDPLTGRAQLLVGGPENEYVPGFSPDGTHVAVIRASADCPTPGDVCPGGEDVIVVGADGGDPRALSASPLLGLRVVTWAPDSRGLVVAYDANGTQRIERFDIGGGAPRTIAQGMEIDTLAFRPPEGRELLVRGIADGRWGLYSMNADGSGRKLLVAAADTSGPPGQDLNFPTYSPDGSQIYYNRYVPQAETIQAWVMNADGSAQHRFNASGPASGWWEGEMAPSPDGKSVLMWRVAPNGGGNHIALFPADGSGDGVDVGPPVAGTAHWAWAPDSTRVLLNFNDAAEGDQGLIVPSTGSWMPLPWHADSEPDWQRMAR